MILLTRFPRRDRIALNPDLIERVEAIPDTVLTLSDGTRYVVEERVEEVVEVVMRYRAEIMAMAQQLAAGPAVGAPLRLVRDAEPAGATPTPEGRSQP